MYLGRTIKRYRAVKEVGQIKMCVGVIAYNQLMLVCQVNISFLFLGCNREGGRVWIADGILYLSSHVAQKITEFELFAYGIRLLWLLWKRGYIFSFWRYWRLSSIIFLWLTALQINMHWRLWIAFWKYFFFFFWNGKEVFSVYINCASYSSESIEYPRLQ